MGINISQSRDLLSIPTPTEYTKGQVKTRDLVSVNRNLFLGSGAYGSVFVAKGDATKAVKKSSYSMIKEYQIGAQLNHKNLVKIHALFIKHFPDRTRQDLHKLVMDRIVGKAFNHVPYRSLPFAKTADLIQQAMDTCLYLFEQKICWDDLHGENVYLQENPLRLIVADFGFWFTMENPKIRAIDLVNGLQRIVSLILSLDAQLSEKEKQQLLSIFWEGSLMQNNEKSVRKGLETYMETIKQLLSLYKDRHPESHVEEPLRPA